MLNHIEEAKKAQIDQVGITLCYALFAYNDGLISDEVMNLYRDTFAPEICQLFPQPLDDKELREKIARELHKQMYGSQDQWEMNPYDDMPKDVVEYLLQRADQLLALLQPKIEEARKQERERMLRNLEDGLEAICAFMQSEEPEHISNSLRITLRDMLVSCWQALSGKGSK